MNNWYLNIPQIVYFYWGRNKPLSYMKYLSVISFSRLNPNWKIIIYYPTETNKKEDWSGREQKKSEYDGKDYFEELYKINNVEVRQVKIDLDLSEVHKSDWLRLWLLSSVGGVWSDFDIFYIKPISELQFNKKETLNDTFVCCHYDYHSIGFLMSSPNNKFFKELYTLVTIGVNNKKDLEYQSIGNYFYTHFFMYSPKQKQIFDNKFNVNIKNIPFTCLYPFDWKQVDLIFGQEKQLYDNTIGIHWFAGSEKTSKYENIVTEKNIKTFNDKLLLKLMGDIIL